MCDMYIIYYYYLIALFFWFCSIMGKRKLTLISMIEVIHLIVETAYCIGNNVALN